MLAARRGAGVQPARGAAASHSRLHQRAPEQARRRRSDPRRTQPRRHRQRPEQGAGQLHRRRCASCENCGAAPDIKGITGWLNTPGGKPIDLKALRGKVVLVDFWAYSCINCQRAIPHVVDWYKAYHDAGFEVIGVHTPEYAFEKVPGNVDQRRRRPGHHLPGRAGQQLLDVDELPQPVLARGIPDRRERHRAAHHVRRGRLRRHREADPSAAHQAHNPASRCRRPVDAADTTPQAGLTPETYFGVGKVVNYAGTGATPGQADVRLSRRPCPTTVRAARADGHSTTRAPPPTATTPSIELNYHAKNVYIVVGGTGTVTVTRDGETTTIADQRAADAAPDRHRRSQPEDHSTCISAKGCRPSPSPTADRRSSQ